MNSYIISTEYHIVSDVLDTFGHLMTKEIVLHMEGLVYDEARKYYELIVPNSESEAMRTWMVGNPGIKLELDCN